MATLDSFDLPDSKRSLGNSADPSTALLMQLYLMAPTISALLAVLTAAFFSLSSSLYFPTSNKRRRRRQTALAKIALVGVPLILPPPLKTRAHLQLFVGPTLAESVSLHWLSY